MSSVTQLLSRLADEVERVGTGPAFDLPASVHAASRVRLVGMGTSFNAAREAEAAFAAGGMSVTTQLASDLLARDRGLPVGELIVLVSDGGRSRETVDLGARLARDGTNTTLGVTRLADSPLASTVDHVVPVADVDGDLPCATQSALVLALAGIAARMTGRSSVCDPANAANEIRAYGALLPQVAEQLGDALAVVDVIGSQRTVGVAAQVALALREIARIPAQEHDLANYRHGYIESAHADHLIVLIASDGDDADRRIAKELAETGTRLLSIGPSWATVPVRTAGALRGTVEAALPCTLAYLWGEKRGITAWDFRFTGVSMLTQV